eukprot:299597-Chlamydomonas_euryale.AAC.2
MAYEGAEEMWRGAVPSGAFTKHCARAPHARGARRLAGRRASARRRARLRSRTTPAARVAAHERV